MKFNIFKKIAPVAFAALVGFGSTACMNDLDQSVKDPQTNTEVDLTGLLAKVYGSLHLTGQTGGTGTPDMSQFDEGNSGFYRRVFEANELCSDECIWTWQGDTGIPELTFISWNSSHGYNELTYYRMMYNVTLCNYYIDLTKDMKEADTYRAETRFLRALMYFQFLDLYGKAPYKLEYNDTDLPVEANAEKVFNFVESELLAITGSGSEVLNDYNGGDDAYGRADKYAAYMLLARLYLNSETYIGKAQWEKAREYADKVIEDGKYKLNTTALNGYSAYEQLFMGDNGENPNARQEIIFPIRCDGATSRSYAGSIYPIASCTGDGTPDQGLPSSQWTCNRARQALVDKFISKGSSFNGKELPAREFAKMAGDDRALFFVDAGRVYETEEKTTFKAGFSILKWSNIYAQGGTPKDVTFPDTDIPFMRVAEAYLTRAEANFRLGETDAARADIQTIRDRAGVEGDVQSLSEKDIIDEWCREFYMEGRRRSDLNRFGMFTGSSYVWDWKGGSYAGSGVSSIYKVYPIPYAETSANDNMHQNTGY